MARDRQRAKQRRDRERRAPGHTPREPRTHRPRPDRTDRPRAERTERDEAAGLTPDPLDHASGEVEEAEAYLAAGAREARTGAAPETFGDPAPETPADRQEALTAAAADLDDLDGSLTDGGEHAEGGRGRREPGRGGAVALPDAGGLEGAARRGNVVVNFLRASWRELQRVQWPDRRQVVQATSVVIGFVIVAGVFLGAAGFVASKIVDAIV